MLLCGCVQGLVPPPGRTHTLLRPFWYGWVAGAAPWVVLVVNIVGSSQVPGFVYGIFVAPVHGFSGFAGSISLSLIATPVITRTTQDVLRLQSTSLR